MKYDLKKENIKIIKDGMEKSIMIFEGEYKDCKKYKGKEYNEDGKLIFEGEYINAKRWNGKGKEYPYLDDKLTFD